MSREALAALARSAAAAHRLGMVAQGGEALARLVDGLGGEIGREPAMGARLGPILSEIVAAQQRGDWIGVADGLEYGLAPVVGRMKGA